MQRALALAANGKGLVEPNPMVGAVVLSANGEVIGEGWHERFGEPHAEVNAFAGASAAASGGTLYVTLEPCCHHGKTPPCTDAVLRSGVRRVVVAMTDPFPKVAGGGLAILRAAGLEVLDGVCEAEAKRLNAPYLHRLHTGRPWVIAKWAMSLDGKIATRTGESQWISSAESRKRVHDLRGRVDAILVGRGTVVADDPLLTARPTRLRTATRVIISSSGDLPSDSQLRRTARETPTLVYTSLAGAARLTGWVTDGVEVIATAITIEHILLDLGQRGFTNVLVEGGAGLLGSFHDADRIDEVQIYIAPLLIGNRTAPSPVAGLGIEHLSAKFNFNDVHIETIGADMLIVARK